MTCSANFLSQLSLRRRTKWPARPRLLCWSHLLESDAKLADNPHTSSRIDTKVSPLRTDSTRIDILTRLDNQELRREGWNRQCTGSDVSQRKGTSFPVFFFSRFIVTARLLHRSNGGNWSTSVDFCVFAVVAPGTKVVTELQRAKNIGSIYQGFPSSSPSLWLCLVFHRGRKNIELMRMICMYDQI